MEKRIKQNNKFSTIELSYTRKPGLNILELLRLSDYKWATTKKHWFAPNTQVNMSFAKSLGKTVQTKLAL